MLPITLSLLNYTPDGAAKVFCCHTEHVKDNQKSNQEQQEVYGPPVENHSSNRSQDRYRWETINKPYLAGHPLVCDPQAVSVFEFLFLSVKQTVFTVNNLNLLHWCCDESLATTAATIAMKQPFHVTKLHFSVTKMQITTKTWMMDDRPMDAWPYPAQKFLLNGMAIPTCGGTEE